MAAPRPDTGTGSDPTASHPPYPRQVFRVGVVGPRGEAPVGIDRARLERMLHQILSSLKSAAVAATEKAPSAEPTLMRLLSTLSPGVPQLAIDVACGKEELGKLGYELQCALPAPRGECETRHAATPGDRFGTLIGLATAVFEFDGRADPAAGWDADRAAAETVVWHSDFLVAFPDDAGGVARLIELARERGIPVILVDPERHTLRFRADEGFSDPVPFPAESATPVPALQRFCREQVRLLIPDAWLPPDPHAPHHKPTEVTATVYYSETRRRVLLLGAFWKMFRDAVAFSLSGWLKKLFTAPGRAWSDFWSRFRVPSPEKLIADLGKSPALPPGVGDQIDRVAAPHYAWADHLSRYYVNRYRSVGTLCYLLAAVAVGMAATGVALRWAEPGHAMHDYQAVWVIAELVPLVAIVGLYLWASGGRWHDRYLTYRLVAEQLRCFRYLACLNRPLPLTVVRRIEGKHKAWVWKHYRAVVAEVGLVTVRADAAYADTCSKLLSLITVGPQPPPPGLKPWQKGEVEYHASIARDLEVMNGRLHWFALGLFFVAMGVCAAHLFWHDPVLTFFAALCPALGAAVAGIRSQGEFDNVIQNSLAMSTRYDRINTQLGQWHPASVEHVVPTLDEFAEVMLTQAIDWNFLFQVQSVRLP